MDDAQTPQTTSIPGAFEAALAMKMLGRCLPRLRKAQGYIPTDADHDKEAGALATLVREIQRFLS